MSLGAKIEKIMTSHWMTISITLLGSCALLELENEWYTMPFSLCILFSLAAIFFTLSRRLAFSVYSAWAVVAIIALTSLTKFKEQGFDLHAYDMVFVGGDFSLHTFLLRNYLHLVLPVAVVALAALLILGWIALRERPRKTSLSLRLLAMGGLFALLPVTIPATAAIDRHEYIVGGHHASAFFVSLLDVPSLFTQSELKTRLAALPAQEPLDDIVVCPPVENRPDVFVVLSETQTPPFNFPQLNLPRNFGDGFKSDDGKTRSLRVETFGGGTWITNFSFMTGLSAADFGWQRPYLTIALQNKVKGALPEAMARCGYRTAAILPVDDAFVNEGPFLRSIGFETVLDQKDIGAGDDRQRDSFYYEAAESFLLGHRRGDGRPLFLSIQTMFPHGPYNERLAPELTIAGEPFSEHDEINEYVRRLHIARGDFQAFLSARRVDPTGRGAVVLEFGDHQASVTMPFIQEIEGDNTLANADSLAYITHFTTHAFRYKFPASFPEFDRLDIAFLGASFAEAAGLPMTPLMADLLRLRDSCGGRFHSCADRTEVDEHLKRRFSSDQL